MAKKTYYRIVDSRGEPYATCYNETDLKEVALGIFSLGDGGGLWDDEEYYGKTDEEIVEKLYNRLLEGERDFIFIVEEQDTPFDEKENPENYIYGKYLPKEKD